jgi:hypothetical protein
MLHLGFVSRDVGIPLGYACFANSFTKTPRTNTDGGQAELQTFNEHLFIGEKTFNHTLHWATEARAAYSGSLMNGGHPGNPIDLNLRSHMEEKSPERT